MESRHLDVIEMDAASHNGVDDVRQINDAIRYAPVSPATRSTSSTKCTCCRRGLQRAAEDAGGAAAARQIHLRHHRDPQGAGHGAVALPALRPAPRRCRTAGEASAGIAAKEGIDGRAGGAGDDRARRRRLGARCAVAARSGDRACGRRRCAPRTCAQMLGLADRTRIIDLFEALMRGDVAAALERIARSVRHRRRSGDGARRSRRVHPFRHPHEGRAGGGRRFVAGGRPSARAGASSPRSCRCGCCRAPGRCCSRASPRCRSRPADRRGRNGAGAHRLCGRAADAGRGDPLARGDGDGRRGAPRANAARRDASASADAPRVRRASTRRADAPRRSRGAASASRWRSAAPQPQNWRRRWRSRRSGIWWRWRSESATCRSRLALERDMRLVRARMAGWRSRWSRAPPRRWSTSCRASSRNGPASAGW